MNIKTIFGLLGTLLFLTTLCFAQQFEDIEIVESVILENDLIEFSENPATNLGGLVSSIFLENRQYLNFLGLDVFENITTTNIENFTIFLVNVDTTPDFLNMIDIGLFETSEEIELRGTNLHSYETRNQQYTIELADYQTEKALNAAFSVRSDGLGSKVTLTIDPGNPAILNYQMEGGLIRSFDPPVECDSGTCPTIFSIYDNLGVTYTKIFKTAFRDFEPELLEKDVFYTTGNGNPSVAETFWLCDLNNDGIMEHSITEQVRSANSFEGQVLVFDTPQIRDIWISF